MHPLICAKKYKKDKPETNEFDYLKIQVGIGWEKFGMWEYVNKDDGKMKLL